MHAMYMYLVFCMNNISFVDSTNKERICICSWFGIQFLVWIRNQFLLIVGDFGSCKLACSWCAPFCCWCNAFVNHGLICFALYHHLEIIFHIFIMGYGLHGSWERVNQHEIYIAINGVHKEIIGEILFTPIFAYLAPTLKCSKFL